ncbi:MAG: septum formation initiator family protein [Hyphomicrobiaceae bacterium]
MGKGQLKSLAVVLIGVGLTAYFLHHARFGAQGLEARRLLVERKNGADLKLASLETAREILRRDVELLRRAPPDPDLVAEIAQTTLGFAFPGDRIVLILAD